MPYSFHGQPPLASSETGGSPDSASRTDLPDPALVYDGDCPFCSAYVKRVRLREAMGELRLINARDVPGIVVDMRARGFDLDEGMVLMLGGEYYYGDECLHRLALMSTPVGWFNRLNARLFSNEAISSVAYPILRAGRNAALLLLRRKRLRDPAHAD